MCKQASVTIDEAAAELATTQVKVLMLLKQKALEGELVDGEWSISRASLMRLKLVGIGPAQQPSCRSTCTSSGCGCS